MGLMTKDQYIESLRQLNPVVYMFGERVTNVVDNPRLRGGIEATGATYEVAEMDEYKHLAVTESPLINEPVNRFCLPPASIDDLVHRVKLNRAVANHVGTCHQRCTGLDCLSALSIVTYDVDQKYNTNYQKNFNAFLEHMQKNDYTANAGVTDIKGDRSKGPTDQLEDDMYLKIVERRSDGIVVSGAKVHQTGSLSSHEIIVIPTRALKKGDEDYAVAFAIPADTEGLIHVVGRSSLDTREMEGVDCGNLRYSKNCPTLIFDNVFVPNDRIFLCGETEFAVDMVVKFSSFHRQSHGGCKSGKVDCMIGAALTLMDYNGTSKVAHHKQKIIDMIHRAETLYACCLASSYEGKIQPSGAYFINTIMSNASKIHEGKELAECIRLMIDIVGGWVADMPSDNDFNNPEIGGMLKKYFQTVEGVAVEDRIKMFRLVEKMAMESADTISDIHGGGSPEAHRVTILRESDLESKKRAAKRLAGIED